MKKNNVPGLVVFFLLVSQAVWAQGFGEYGRLLGGLGQKNGGVPKGVTPGPEDRGSVKQRSFDSNGVSGIMPAALSVESDEAVLYARSEDWADKMMQLPRGSVG
jgi:hypothetical protein